MVERLSFALGGCEDGQIVNVASGKCLILVDGDTRFDYCLCDVLACFMLPYCMF